MRKYYRYDKFSNSYLDGFEFSLSRLMTMFMDGMVSPKDYVEIDGERFEPFQFIFLLPPEIKVIPCHRGVEYAYVC